MLKFQGKISRECEKWFIKREFLCCLFIGLCTTLITGIGIVLFAVYWNLVALYFFIIPVLLTFMLCFQCISKYILKRLPLIITIEDGYIEGKNENEETWRNLDLLKTITDFGRWKQITAGIADATLGDENPDKTNQQRTAGNREAASV